jgi:Fe-S-cluster-containing hydrogenase component 2
MAMQIEKNCFACYACETVCPAGAISIENSTFVINPALCNECSDNESPRCIAICPEAGVITRIDDK